MRFWELLALAVGLSMDAFAVSVCKGLSASPSQRRVGLTCGLWFGSFQQLMPLIGFGIGSLFLSAIARVDHWIAFGLLETVGWNLLREACSADGDDRQSSSLSVGTMLVLSIATSVDALAVGVSLAMAGKVQIVYASLLIGAVTCLLSGIGARLGSFFGSRCSRFAQIAGSLIMLLLGFRILWEHLEIK